MSASLYLACIDCKELIWIGQRHFDRSYIYTEEKDTMELLDAFLHKHMAGDEMHTSPDGDVSFDDSLPKHRLIFGTEYKINIWDYDNWIKMESPDNKD